MDELNGTDEREAALAALAGARRASAPAAAQVKRALRRRLIVLGLSFAAFPLVMKSLNSLSGIAYGVGYGVFLAILIVMGLLARRGPVRLDEWRRLTAVEWLAWAVTFVDMLVIVLVWTPVVMVIGTLATLAAWGHAAWRVER
jgi:hypothetical protein